MNEDDDIENEEFDGLQSYARKGMAQELARKLGLLGNVPGADSDQQDSHGDGTGAGPDAAGDGSQSGEAQIDPEMLQQILAALGKGQ